MSRLAERLFITKADYLASETLATEKHEYLNGFAFPKHHLVQIFHFKEHQRWELFNFTG